MALRARPPQKEEASLGELTEARANLLAALAEQHNEPPF